MIRPLLLLSIFLIFLSCQKSEPEYLIDSRDGHQYATVEIGDQIWMAENLRATVYSDGSPIALIEDAAQWAVQSGSGAWCWYDNNNSNQYTYGALYNFYAAMNGEQIPPAKLTQY